MISLSSEGKFSLIDSVVEKVSKIAEEKKNLYEVYINIYFHFITYERLEQIIQMLNGKNEKELQYIETQFGTIRNDIKLESEIENVHAPRCLCR